MVRFRIVFFNILLFLMFLFQPISANHSFVVNMSKAIYKADNKNWGVAQDNRGFLYFANDRGLLQFDGFEWKLFQLPNRTIVRSVLVGSDERIYTGSFEDFGFWERNLAGELVYTSLGIGVPKKEWMNDDFWKIVETDSLIYFQSFSSIYAYDGEKVNRIPTDRGFLFIQEVPNELYIQAINGPLFHLQGMELDLVPGSELLSESDVRIILPGKELNSLLIGTTKGFYTYNQNRFNKLETATFNELTDSDPNVAVYSRNNTYYIGTLLNGVYEVSLDGEIIEHIGTQNNLQSNTVLSLLQDNLGDLWLGLDGGISFIKKMPDMSIFIDEQGSFGSVYDAKIWGDHLLLATNQRVYSIPLNQLDAPNPLSHLKPLAGSKGQVWKFKEIDGKLYCLHTRGFLEITDELKVKEYSKIPVGFFDAEKALLGGKEQILLGSYSSLWLYDPKNGSTRIIEEPKQPISKVAVDHLENVWLEHPDKGVYRCRFDEAYTKFNSINHYGGGEDQLPYRLQIFRVGGRVEVYGDGTFYTYNEYSDEMRLNHTLNELLKDIHVKHVVHVSGANFWAIGDQYIARFSYDGYNAKLLSTYDLDPSLALVNRYEQIALLNDSTHLICLDNGFLLYKVPEEEQDELVERLSPPVINYLKTVSKQGEDFYLPLDKEVKIPFTRNSVYFGISAMNSYSLNLGFEYRLREVEKRWNRLDNSGTLGYQRLPSGKYTLEVRSVNRENSFSSVTSLPFIVQSPWYFTPWAILLYLLLVLSIFYGIWTLVLKRYRNIHLHKVRMREVARLRTVASSLKEKVESRNAELFTLTSFIIHKNELISNLRNLVHEFYEKTKLKGMIPLTNQVDALINQSLNPEADWKLFLIKFEEKHANFFARLKEMYPDLTNNDLRLCACLKLNMDTKEIASLMNATVRSVENNRYRLRKKLGLDSSQNLNEFLIQIS